MTHEVKIKDFSTGQNSPFTVMSGPCVIESEEHTFSCAKQLKELFAKLKIQFVFKASYDKANRSSATSFRGPGMEKGLAILKRIKEELDLPVVTDIHTPEQAAPVGEVCDILQIPAFLCRQTDLLIAAGETGKVIQVKKGQFMAPWEMKNIVEKLLSTGNKNIILVDRGTSFGYQNLVSDMRCIPIMKQLGYPVYYDASHSVQLPGAQGTSSGGQREFIPYLSRAAVAAGASGIYIESHPNPSEAKSDATTVFPFDQLAQLMQELKKIYEVVNTTSATV